MQQHNSLTSDYEKLNLFYFPDTGPILHHGTFRATDHPRVEELPGQTAEVDYRLPTSEILAADTYFGDYGLPASATVLNVRTFTDEAERSPHHFESDLDDPDLVVVQLNPAPANRLPEKERARVLEGMGLDSTGTAIRPAQESLGRSGRFETEYRLLGIISRGRLVTWPTGFLRDTARLVEVSVAASQTRNRLEAALVCDAIATQPSWGGHLLAGLAQNPLAAAYLRHSGNAAEGRPYLPDHEPDLAEYRGKGLDASQLARYRHLAAVRRGDAVSAA